VPLTIIGNQALFNADKPDVALRDLNSVSTVMWLQQRGVDPDSLKFVEIPGSASLAALDQHRIDAVVYAQTAWAAAHPELVHRFLVAFNEANAYVVAHEAEGDAVMAQFAGLDPSTATSIHHPERAAAIAPSDVQPVIDAAAKMKLIPKIIPAAEMICSCALRE
jgi:ABC-type nitrate/sulfonate/bicarbonate transport system substrate-binding protein